MKILFKGGHLAMDGAIKPMDFVVDKGKFSMITAQAEASDCEIVPLEGMLVLPGLVDIHTHGAAGIDFNLFTQDEISRVLSFYLKNGVTSLFPTIVSDASSRIIGQITMISELQKDFPEIKGIHLEGPYISRRFKGAIPETNLKNPDIFETKAFIKAAKGLHIHMTLSPETENAPGFIKAFANDNITFSLGHSGATYEETEAAVAAGARCFTHAFNAMKPFDHHNPGIVGYMLSSDCYLELIADGHHLAKDTLKVLSRLIDPERLILVTDSIMATGFEDGTYYLSEVRITVKRNQAMLFERKVRAGSTLTGFEAVNNYSRFTNTPLEKAVLLMSSNPAKMLGMDNEFGRIAKGLDADFLILEAGKIKSVYVKGVKKI